MSQVLYMQIKNLLEETSDAFVTTGAVNIDYAGFASLVLSDFKKLLDAPDLTGKDLRRLIRKAEQRRRTKDPDGCWSTFIAQYVARNANQNLEQTMRFHLKDIYKENS